MASLNLAGKTSGYVKVTAPDDSSTNPTVVLQTESGELALKSDITGGGGGIPEAPVDGKQYARKDADWSEVEATSGGGDVEAQPPVAFDLALDENQTLKEKLGRSKHNQAAWIVNQAKWEAARAYCQQKGIYFRIVTEKDIFHNGRR